jgi:hypothetical protein
MNLFVASLIIAGVVATAVTAMLLVRRFAAPSGGFFTKTDRAAGIFGVTGTGFFVLLAFVIFLAFSSYDRAREKASIEAVAVTQLFRTARVFPPADKRELDAELICYARAVIHDEWRTMRDARESPLVNRWLLQIENTTDAVRLRGETEIVAYGHWFDETAQRREGRRGRLAEAKPLVPLFVWLALLVGGALVIVFMCCFADPAEVWFAQATMMVAVATTVVAGLLVVYFLDHPYTGTNGSIKPTEMSTTLRAMESESHALGVQTPRLCDDSGRAVH